MTSASSDADDLCGNCLHTRDKHGGPGEVCWATNAIHLFTCQCERFEERA